ncbi:MAG: 30S ribosomal protein S12 methylthiotransferase RimO [Lachnospiraceae bacterium]|nr:30S ribosomal protein S12 methylthiotransferase RimO [Candidatus Merdinaster equi]
MVKIYMVSLGCDKNLVDTEVMLGILAKNSQYELTDDENEAEVIIVNTCCFIGDAKEESIQTLIEMGQLKETGKAKALIATGCLAQRYSKEIREQLPEVDAIIGTLSIDSIERAVNDVLTGKNRDYMEDIDRKPVVGKQVLTTGGHYAYLKIAEGCDKRCTYCVIPKVRGNYRSVPMEELVNQASSLALGGVKELILVAQETTLYGRDLYGEKKLPELLDKLCEIAGIEWIRLMYCYPEEITDELIAVMKRQKKICHYLDLPIQHASDNVLKSMGRRTSREAFLERISYIRKEIPDICLRTSLIAGFPGETDEDVDILVDFIKEVRFDRLGCFTYSREEDTVAYAMKGQIPEREKKKRRARVMETQQQIAFDIGSAMVGKVCDAFVEGEIPNEADPDTRCYVARTYRDAPGVDGYVFVNSNRQLMSGDIVRVQITGQNDYDLIGTEL